MVWDHLSKKLQVTKAVQAIDLGIHVKLLFYLRSLFHLSEGKIQLNTNSSPIFFCLENYIYVPCA